MLDVLPALLVASGVAAALWFLQRRLFGAAGSRPRAAVRLTAVVLIALVAVAYGAFQLSKSRHVQLLGDLATHVETDQKVVALTFDDGPEAVYTQQIIDVLRDHDARATFFVIGGECRESPQSLRALVRAGHEIGNHTWSHPRLLAMSQTAIRDEIERTDAVIRAAGYEGPVAVRPPNGKRLIAAPYYLRRNGRTTVMWDLEPDSIAGICDDADAMVKYVRENVRPGSIILMHVMYEARGASREALPRILDGLSADGYRFVTVSELLALRES